MSGVKNAFIVCPPFWPKKQYFESVTMCCSCCVCFLNVFLKYIPLLLILYLNYYIVNKKSSTGKAFQRWWKIDSQSSEIWLQVSLLSWDELFKFVWHECKMMWFFIWYESLKNACDWCDNFWFQKIAQQRVWTTSDFWWFWKYLKNLFIWGNVSAKVRKIELGVSLS